MSREDFNEYMNQAKTLLGQGKGEEALKYFSKAEQEDNMNEEVYLGKGIALANLERYEEAKTELSKVLKLKKDNGLAIFHLANIEVLLGNKAKGIELFNNAIATGYDNAQVFYSLGLMQEDDGDDNLAIRNYTKAIIKDPNRPDIRIRKIRVQIKNNYLQEALQSIDELILSNPDVFEGYHLKFLVLESQAKYDEAEAVIDEALSIFKKDVNFALDKASVLIDKKKYDEALQYLANVKETMEVSDTNLALRQMAMLEARTYAFKEDIEGLISSLNKAIDFSKKNNAVDSEALFMLMNCYITQEKFEEVLTIARALKDAEEENTYTITGHYYEAFALKGLNRMDEAMPLFKEAVSFYRSKSLANPGFLDFYSYRVMCLREMGEYDKALEIADYLVNVGEKVAEMHILKATVLEVAGRKEEADAERKLAATVAQPGSTISKLIN